MKRKDIKSLHDKTIAELILMTKELRGQIQGFSLEKTKEKNVHVAKEKRKDLARVLTALTQKEFAAKSKILGGKS